MNKVLKVGLAVGMVSACTYLEWDETEGERVIARTMELGYELLEKRWKL